MTQTQKNIIKIIIEEMGLDPDSLGDISLLMSIQGTMNRLGHISEEDFLYELTKNRNSIRQLIEDVKVPETWFFRDSETFAYLEKFTQTNYKFANNYPIRILSAPCSTGEEPYSIAMTLMNLGLKPNQFSIKAVDISDDNIQKAKKGLFTKSSFRNMDEYSISRYFKKVDYRYQLNQDVLECNIEFMNLNLVKEFYKFDSEEFDVVFFKNLLIYLNEDSRQYILQNLKRVLKINSVLFVGVSELNYFIRNGFEPINHNLSFACKKKIEQDKVQLSQPKKSYNFTPKTEKPVIKPRVSINEGKSTRDLQQFDSTYIKKLMDLGKYNEAENEINNYKKANINNYEIYFNLGMIKFVSQNYNIAKENFLKSLYLEPNHYDTLIYLSIVEKELGFFNKSENYRLRAEKVYNRINNE